MAVSFSFHLTLTLLYHLNESRVEKQKRRAIEEPSLVGPMGETLMMDVDLLTGANAWRGESSSSSELKVGNESKKERLSSFEVARKTYKRGKGHFIGIIRVHRTASSMEGYRNHVLDGRHWQISFVTSPTILSRKPLNGSAQKTSPVR